MFVYFLRHAEAEPHCEDDLSRALTTKGQDQARRVAAFIQHSKIPPAPILTSHFVRARETAAIVADELQWDAPREEAWLGCGMAAETCFRQLSRLSAHTGILLVGHEPDFGDTIAEWIGAPSGDSLHIRKASLTALEVSTFSPEGARLEFCIPARLM